MPVRPPPPPPPPPPREVGGVQDSTRWAAWVVLMALLMLAGFAIGLTHDEPLGPAAAKCECALREVPARMTVDGREACVCLRELSPARGVCP